MTLPKTPNANFVLIKTNSAQNPGASISNLSAATTSLMITNSCGWALTSAFGAIQIIYGPVNACERQIVTKTYGNFQR